MSREQGEKRQMGGMLLFQRTRKGVVEALLIRDDAKMEISAGFRKWSPARKSTDEHIVYGFPGGGRGKDLLTDQAETLPQTLVNELKEEIGVIMTPEVELARRRKQVHPFIVGQIPERENKINEFAVTSIYAAYDNLPKEVRDQIQCCVVQKVAQWQPLAELNQLFVLCNTSQEKTSQENVSSLDVRYPALMAAHLWYLEKIQRFDIEKIMGDLMYENRVVHDLIYAKSRRQQELTGRAFPVNNGTFTDQGHLLPPEQLSLEDRRYLLRLSRLPRRLRER